MRKWKVTCNRLKKENEGNSKKKGRDIEKLRKSGREIKSGDENNWRVIGR